MRTASSSSTTPLVHAPTATVGRAMAHLAWPSLIENVSVTFLGIASLMMVGRLGPAAVAAVGAGNQVAQLMLVAFNGLSVGNTALVARAVGAGDLAAARTISRQALLLGVSLATVLAVAGAAATDLILLLLTPDPAVRDLGGVYLRASMLSLPLLVILLVGNGSLRGAGDTRTPMTITLAINVVNIVVAWVLIFGLFGLPRLGVAGAAWGIVAARLAGTVMVLFVLFRGETLLSERQGVGGLRLERSTVRRLLYIGGPAAAESASVQLGLMAFNLIVLHMGTAAYAAQQIVFNVASLSMMPGQAFSVAATTLVGQALGARNPGRAREAGWTAMRSAALWMALMGVVFFAFPELFVRLYTGDPEVIRLGAVGMRVVGLGQPFQAAAFVLGGALRGAGATRATFVVGTLGVWLVRVPFAYLLGHGAGWGIGGVWTGWAADWLLRGSVLCYVFWRGRWQA